MINTKHPKYDELDEYTKLAINSLHYAREIIEQQASLNDKIAERLYIVWYELELALQDLWGFEYDPNRIKWWKYPRCTCPKLDNEDAYPAGYYITNDDCPIHGVNVNEWR